MNNKRDKKGKSLIAFPENYIVIDVETTGLDPCFDEIIEINAMKVEHNIVTDNFYSLVKPSFSIPEFITDLTGITDDMVNNSSSSKEVLLDFFHFVDKGILVGHNVNFDINFIYDTLLKSSGIYLSNDFVDTMRLSRKLLPALPNHRLCDLADFYKLTDSVDHRADSDCLIINQILYKLKEECLSKYKSIDDFHEQTKPFHNKLHAVDISTDRTYFDTSNPLYIYCKLL